MLEALTPLFVALGLLTGVALVPVLVQAFVRLRLGGYVHLVNPEAVGSPAGGSDQLTEARSVCVVGAGVAGLTAALVLARRGYRVTLLEKNEHLGGKLGSFEVPGPDGAPVWVSHGFHAFFAHYENLNRILDSLDLRDNFQSIGDYVILGRDGQALRFADVETTPLLNIISLMQKKMFSFGDAVRAPGRDMYGLFLEYDPEVTFRDYDHISYAEFVETAQVPPALKLAFNTFARAFFSSEDRLSLAELIKSFHFYYLSHDGGLVYEYPLDDYHEGLLTPWRNALERRGAIVKTQCPVTQLKHDAGAFTINGETYDKVVIATDVVGTRAILGNGEGLPEGLTSTMNDLRPGQRYAIVRMALDKDVRQDMPVFVITEKARILDSVTTFHRFEKQAMEQLSRTKGAASILELHSYAVPDDLPDAEVESEFLKELELYFPELEGARVLWKHLQLNRDFTAFHVGCYEHRPTVETGVEGLYCAGDWVKLPFPAMLLEGACASGVCAANAILSEDGLRQEPVYSVPPRGMLAGFPSPPGRRDLLDLAKSRRENRKERIS